jgi:hypothetical protein
LRAYPCIVSARRSAHDPPVTIFIARSSEVPTRGQQKSRCLLTLVDSYPTSVSPFDSGGHMIAQFIRSLQCSFDPDISIPRAAICPAGSL